MRLAPGKLEELADLQEPGTVEIYAQGAAFYVACAKNGFSDEATEFAEWFLDTFDLDLET